MSEEVTILIHGTIYPFTQCGFNYYTIDDSKGVGPPFDKIGGLHTEVCTSLSVHLDLLRLLLCYDEGYVNKILHEPKHIYFTMKYDVLLLTL